MKSGDIRRKWQIAKEQKDLWQRRMDLLKQMYRVRKKMLEIYKHPKFGEMLVFDCPEKYCEGRTSLAFCTVRCTIKCEDYRYVKKRYPQLVEMVRRLNDNYANLLQKFEEIKGLDL